MAKPNQNKGKAKPTEKQRRKAAHRKQRLKTPPVIPLEDKTKQGATVTMLKDSQTSDQAATDLTINTESAPDMGAIPPADSYDGPDAADDLLQDDPTVNADEPIPNEVVTDGVNGDMVGEETPQRSPTNEELCATAIEQAAAEEKDTADKAIAEWSLANLRDAEWVRNTIIFIFLWLDRIGTGWTNWTIAVGAKAKSLWEAACAWSAKQLDRLEAAWQRRFPPAATKEDLIIFARALAGYLDDRFDVADKHVDNMTMRLSKLENIISGKTPQHCPADKLDAFVTALKSGKKADASRLRAALTREKLTDAKAAVEKLS